MKKQRCRHNAFGEVVAETGTWPDEVPFGYQPNWLYLADTPEGSPLYLSPTRVYHAGVGTSARAHLAAGSPAVTAALVWRHERTGRPLGDDGFVERLGRTLGRTLRKLKPGPRPRRRR